MPWLWRNSSQYDRSDSTVVVTVAVSVVARTDFVNMETVDGNSDSCCSEPPVLSTAHNAGPLQELCSHYPGSIMAPLGSPLLV